MNAEDAMSFAGTWWLLLLVAGFAVVLVYALWPKNKKKFDEAARIPLEDDDDGGQSVEVDELSGAETTGHEWDGLKELNNPLPKWWLWTFYVTVIWSLAYFMLYPAWPWFGGATKGLLGWSSRQEVTQELASLRAEQKTYWDNLSQIGLEEIRSNPELLQFAMASGGAAFGDNCAPCHGTGAIGAKGYPNLNDDDWLWGGSLDEIHQSILVGIRSVHDDTRDNEMPAFGRDEILDQTQILNVAGYSRSLSGLETPSADLSAGKELYAEQCVACHGEDGKGNTELGSPDLTNNLWLYGGDLPDVIETLTISRKGVMPAWDGRLDPPVIKALAVYVHSLGGGV